MTGRILIVMRVFWARSGVEDVAGYVETPRRRPKARASRPLRGGFGVSRGRRCGLREGGRIRFSPRLATKHPKAVKTGPSYEDTT